MQEGDIGRRRNVVSDSNGRKGGGFYCFLPFPLSRRITEVVIVEA